MMISSISLGSSLYSFLTADTDTAPLVFFNLLMDDIIAILGVYPLGLSANPIATFNTDGVSYKWVELCDRLCNR